MESARLDSGSGAGEAASLVETLTRFITWTSATLGLALGAAGLATGQGPVLVGAIGGLLIAAAGFLQISGRRHNPSMLVMVSGAIVVMWSGFQPPALTLAAALCLAAIGTPVILLHGPRPIVAYLLGLGAALAALVVIETGWSAAAGAALVVVAAAVYGAGRLHRDVTSRLRRSEDRFHSSFDRAPMPLALIASGRFIEVNRAFCETLGYDREELKSLGPERIVHPDDLVDGERFFERLEAEAAGGGESSGSIDQRYVTKSGTTLWTRTSVTSVPGSSQTPIWMAHIVDLSSQRHALDELHRSEQRHRALVDLLPVGIWEEDYSGIGAWLGSLRESGVEDLHAYLSDHPEAVRDAASHIVVSSVNPAAVRFVGAADASQLLGRIPEETITDDTVASLASQFLALWEGRTSMSTDVVGTTIGGEPLDGKLQLVVPTIDGRPDLQRVLVTITDLTERRKAERALEERLELENLIAQLSTHFINLDPSHTDGGIEEALEAIGRHVHADRSYVFRFDHRRRRLSNSHEWCAPGIESMQHRIQDVPVDEFSWFNSHLLAGRPLVIADIAELPDDAHAERVEFATQGIRSLINVPMVRSGEVVGFIGFDSLGTPHPWSGADVQLLRLVGEMFVNALARRDTDRRLAGLMESKDRLIASVSHELRTPLTAVLGLAEELRERDDIGEWERRELLEVIAEQSHELTHIVEDLLVASRVETGELHVEARPISVSREIGHDLRLLPSPRGRTVEVDPTEMDAWGDPVRVRQILRNLVTNAYRYGGDRIRIGVRRCGDTVAITVFDDGAGIPGPQRAAVFEPYERAHETPGRTGSLGLGLAVSRHLARLMGGDLVYRDADGSVFELVLPGAHPEGAPPDPFEGTALVDDELPAGDRVGSTATPHPPDHV